MPARYQQNEKDKKDGQVFHSQVVLNIWMYDRLPITARQYGEVVLPDDSTGQGPDTLARKLSRCKEGMARVFAVQVQILLSITCVAVQV